MATNAKMVFLCYKNGPELIPHTYLSYIKMYFYHILHMIRLEFFPFNANLQYCISHTN